MRQRFIPSVPILVATAALGCGSDTPTDPPAANTELAVSATQAWVDGTPLAGSTRQQGFGEGRTMLFEGEMRLGDQPGVGETMWMEYDRPVMGGGHHGGGGGSRHTGRIQLHDDGTHGDEIANDGIYHYADPDGEVGCQRQSHAAGEYHYDFYGEHHDGSQTDHRRITITING